jgi:RNA polymerase sigma-32 factor
VVAGENGHHRQSEEILRRAKSEISAFEEGDLRPDQVMTIAQRVGVSANDVVQMNRRLGGDASLNAPIRDDSDSGDWQDWLVDDAPSQERVLIESEELDNRRSALREALIVLDDRERRIFEARHLADKPITLEGLAEEFGVSHERLRQIEVRTFEKVQNSVRRRVAAMEASQARIAHQPRPFARDRMQEMTLGSTTHLRASLSDVSSVTAAA